jgi:hypothetical protein
MLNLVKEKIWRELQMSQFGIESTKDINTDQINEILDILTLHFGQLGIPVNFPNRFDYYEKMYENRRL